MASSGRAPTVDRTRPPRDLAARDPVLASLVDRHGTPRRPGDRSGSTAGSSRSAETIVYQQLAGRAAATIHGRFVAALRR